MHKLFENKFQVNLLMISDKIQKINTEYLRVLLKIKCKCSMTEPKSTLASL